MAKGAGRKPPASSDDDGRDDLPDVVSAAARLHVWHIQAVRDVLFVAAVIALVWAGYALRAVTVPLLVALLLAYLFEPLIARMSQHPRISRTGAVVALLVTVGGSVLVILAIALPLIVSQTMNFVRDIQDGTFRQRLGRIEAVVPETVRDDFRGFLDLLPRGAESAVRELAEEVPFILEEQPAGPGPGAESADGVAAPALDEQRIREIVGEEIRRELDRRRADASGAGEATGAAPPARQSWLSVARGGVDAIVTAIGKIVQLGLLAFLIPFYFFFFSIWYPSVVRFGRSLIPEKNKERTLELLGKMDAVVSGFVRGRIVISIIMGVLFAIGWLICGVPYAIPLGLIVGVFCAVPYLGVIGVPAAVGLLAFEYAGLAVEERDLWFGWWGVLLWPTLVFAIVQVIESYGITPAIAGKATNLDPVTIIVAVLAGGSVLGVYGMLLAIPLAACGKILCTEVLLPRFRDWTEGKARDPLPIDRD